MNQAEIRAAYPLAHLRDTWRPLYAWRRGGKEVKHEDRNWAYLPDVMQGWGATMNRIAAGDAEFAEKYARHAAHYGIIFLSGAW